MRNLFADDWSIFRIIRAVQLAPSVYNTQPWSFWIRADDRIELRPHMVEQAAGSGIWVVDRQLLLSDEAAREMTISCGAALFNLRMAIRITGHQLAVSLLPDPRDEWLLASVEIMTGRITPPTAEEQELYDAIQRRHTYRGPFTGRQVPHNIITELLEAARTEKGWLRELYRSQVTDWLYAAARAEDELRGFPSYMTELSQWTNGAGPGLGVPKNSYGPRPASPDPPVRDFSTPPDSRPVERFESRPQLLSLATDYNRPLDWLRAGQALQHALLTAAHYGVAASFLTQSLELADHQQRAAAKLTAPTRPPDHPRLPDQIQLADDRHKSRRRPNPHDSPFKETPQMLIRVGYPDHDRDGPQTPREYAPQVIDLRNGRPRPVPPPDGPDWIGPGKNDYQIH
jgi:nitroreductase